MWILFAAALSHAEPCGAVDLVPPAPHVQGAAQAFQVFGVPAGSNVLLFRDGDDPACPAQIAPTCLDLDGTAYLGAATADGAGVATFAVSVPAGIDPSNHGWQAVSQACGVSDLEQTTAASPVSCAYGPTDWSTSCDDGPMGCFLTGWFDAMYPSGMPVFGAAMTVEQVRGLLAGGDARTRAAIALALSVDADDTGLFGARVALGDRVVPSGPYAGYTTREVAVLGLVGAPVPTAVGDTAAQVLQTYDSCGDGQLIMPGWPTYPPEVGPGDSGVPSDSGVVDTGTPADSGAGTDSAVVAETGDTGAAPDSAVVVDTGVPADSAPPADSAVVVDTGVPADSAAPADSAVVVDTGVPADSAAPADSGAAVDTGAPTDSVGVEDTGAPPVGDSGGDSGLLDTGIGDSGWEDTGG